MASRTSRGLAASALALAAAAVLAGCGGASNASRTVTVTVTRAAAAGGAPAQGAAATTAGAGSALSLQQTFVDVVDRVSPSVVQISTASGLGSGVVFDGMGHVVTNAHVVSGSRTFTVTTRSGARLRATLVGTFVPDDLAVIRVVGGTLRPATFGDSSALDVGDLVMAIGNPLGLQSSVTEGIVSALGRNVGEPNGFTLPQVIQTSAAINPGNSGGALVDLSGRVVGIPTLAATDQQLGGGAAPGIGFAIPSNLVQRIASQLVRFGHVVNSGRAYLGVQIGDTGGAGVYVGSVQSGKPAAKAGMQVGDIIVSVAGKPTPTTSALGDVLAGLRPGQTVKVVVERQGGGRRTLNVTLGQYPGRG